MRIDAPCKGCEDRQIGCHSVCSIFAEFKTKMDEEKEAKRKATENVYYKKKRRPYSRQKHYLNR